MPCWSARSASVRAGRRRSPRGARQGWRSSPRRGRRRAALTSRRRWSRSTCGARPSPAARRWRTWRAVTRHGRRHPAAERGQRVRYTIDRMTMPDIPRVIEIEKLAYPSPWPSSAYRKELQENRNAHYIVVRDNQIAVPVAPPVERLDPQRRPFPFSLLPAKQTPIYSHDTAAIIGFSGLWLMVDESHIT